MDKRMRRIERLKTLAIVLLAVSALVLGSMTGLFTQLLSASPALRSAADSVRRQLSAAPDGESLPGEGARSSWDLGPLGMAVGSEAWRCAARYSPDAVGELFQRFSAYLGEALGTAGALEETDEAAWRAALAGESVFFDFLTAQPLTVLTDRLGTAAAESLTGLRARRLCLHRQGERLSLSFSDENGRFYTAATQVSAASVAERIALYTGNGALFAFELSGGAGRLDPYTLILDELPAVSGAAAAVPDAAGDEKTLLAAFGMNSYVANSYPEADGTRVYVEGTGILRVYADGRMLYRRTGSDSGSGGFTDVDAVNLALALADGALRPNIGAGELYLASVDFDSARERYTVRLDYCVNGIPVLLDEGSAAEIQLSGGRVTVATLRCRSFSLEEPLALRPLPEKQAAAIVEVQGGGEPRLTYVENGPSLSLVWQREMAES